MELLEYTCSLSPNPEDHNANVDFPGAKSGGGRKPGVTLEKGRKGRKRAEKEEKREGERKGNKRGKEKARKQGRNSSKSHY